MERGISDLDVLEKFAYEFCKILEKYVEYIIVSGFVSIASGRVRATEDIDLIMKKIDKNTFRKLHEDLVNNNFICIQSDNPDEIYEYLDDKTAVRYTWKNLPVPEMELKFAKDEIDYGQIRTRQKIKLTGTDLWFSSIEWNIAFKEEYLQSDKDLEDAKHLRLVYSEDIDEDMIKEYKRLIKKVRM